MKNEILKQVEDFKSSLVSLRREVANLLVERVNRKGLMEQASEVAQYWFGDLEPKLKETGAIDEAVLRDTDASMQQLLKLSRPSNLAKSYLRAIDPVLSRFDDKYCLPLQMLSNVTEGSTDLAKIIGSIPDHDEADYLSEAIKCANLGLCRAAIVMGWCAAVHHVQKKLISVGFQQLNQASSKLKAQSTGRFKRWNKEYQISTLAELQEIFDTDLIVLLEGMSLIDSNQGNRLRTCFQYRNQSAHPGQAPIEWPHVIAFFTDINEIVFKNSNLSL